MWRGLAPSASSLRCPIPTTTSSRYALQLTNHSHLRFASLHPSTTVRATSNDPQKPISNSQVPREQQSSGLKVNSPSLSSSVLSSTPKLSRQIQPSSELGLLCLLFVLCTAIAAIFSVAVISIPTMISFRRLGTSMDKLKKVISREIPGTAFSLRLSEMEINELTRQLKSLRQKVLKLKRDRNTSKSGTFGEGNDPVSN